MANDRLREALRAAEKTPVDVATALQVDPKTVERWISLSRIPYPKYRHALSAMLKESEAYLWPDTMTGERAEEISTSEIVHLYPHRSAVPMDLWSRLLAAATTEIDILVYVRMFLTEQPDLTSILAQKAEGGAQVRLLFGDRYSAAVTQRSVDEGIGAQTIAAKIDHALAFFKALAGTPGVDVRTHGTVLYNSIYRFDDEMIVNPHVFGRIASHAPALHLRRLSSGEMFKTYTDSFDAVWATASKHEW